MTSDTKTTTTTKTEAYLLTDCESGVTLEIQATDLDDAREQARDWVREGYDPSDSTFWADVRIARTVLDADGDECWEDVETITAAIDPSEPECRDAGSDHEWRSPHALLGGLRENPGVWSHGGGVVAKEICVRCGCGKTTDTWAQNPSDGRQGLTSIKYELGAHEVPWIYDDEHVVGSVEIEQAEEAGACERALEWLRDNVRGISVADVRAHNAGWHQWAIEHLGWGA